MNASETFPCASNGTAAEDPFKLYKLGYLLLESLLGVFIGFGNILVLIAFLKFQELRTSMNVFLVALALADVTVALIVVPLHISLFVFPVLKTVFIMCMLRFCVIIISIGSSAILLCVISADRYVAMNKPLQYLKIMTTGKAKLISIGVLLYTLSFSSLPILGWNEWSPGSECTFTVVLPYLYITMFVLTHFLCAAFVGLLNIKIFFIANKASAGIHARVVSYPGKHSVVNHQCFVKNTKAMKALLMMFSVYAVCILPFGVFFLWVINSNQEITNGRYLAVRVGTTLLTFFNSGLNPLIYHGRIPQFNAAFRKLLGMKAKTKQVKQISTIRQRSRTQRAQDLHIL